MTRRIYPRPPIVEAVIELRFDAETDPETLANHLGSALADQYPGEQQHQQRIEAHLDSRDGSSTSRLVPGTIFVRSADHLRLVGCSPATLSAHVLAPYPGWESFLEQARDAVSALPESSRARRVRSVAVRYIDRFVFPSADIKLEDYLTVLPLAPPGMPRRFAGFHAATQAVDDDGTKVVLTVASAQHGEMPAVLYDLLLEDSADCHVGDPLWVEKAESLHVRQRQIFEASITDRMRELFG